MIKQINLSEPELNSARVFAAKSVSTHIDTYARRRQTDPRQIQHQIEIGKLGEIAVSKALQLFYAEPVKGLEAVEPRALVGVAAPDFEIYDARHKSFDPDLYIFVDGFGQIPIHVKSQDRQSAERFGTSWTFQYGMNVGSDKEIFSPNPNGYVAFVKIDNKTADICGIPLISTLHKYNMFRDPKLAKLRGIKTVIYNDDLQQLSYDDLWALEQDFPPTNQWK